VSNFGLQPGNVTGADPHDLKPTSPRLLLSRLSMMVMIPLR
jgi:hypothetical protein